jgi:flavorubredoxin
MSIGLIQSELPPFGDNLMETVINEIADGIFRLSTFVPDIAPPQGFTFNQFLIRGDEPMLFHTGLRLMFPMIHVAVNQLIKPEQLRWVAFGHVEADECGAMNQWLAAAPRAEVAHGHTGCMVSLNDMADRPPRQLADGEVIDLGGKRVRYVDTPHIPHGWEAGVLYEEKSKTLLCGDLFTQTGNGPALTESDIVGPAIAAEDMFNIQVSIQVWAARSASSRSSRRSRSRSCTVLRTQATARQHCARWPTATTGA